MAEGSSIPGAPQALPGFPTNLQGYTFEKFSGLNTKPTRPSIKDEEMSWCDGFMPVGQGNLRTLYGMAAAIYTVPAGKTISYYRFGNIGANTYAIVFLSDGSIVSVNMATGVSATIAAAATISSPSQTSVGVSQYGSQYILICANQTNGYFVWDGTLFYSLGTIGPQTSITNGGSGYTTPPTITFKGGAGSGAAMTGTVSNGLISALSITNAGSSYTGFDVIDICFTGGGSTGTTAKLTATIVAGAITAVAVTSGGAGYTTAGTVLTAVGGGGGGAALTATVAGGAITAVTVVRGGSGFMSAPTILARDPNNPVAAAYVIAMPQGIQGTTIETCFGRVWIANGQTVTFTAPSSVQDFSPVNGGGAFASTDSFLKQSYIRLIQTNGFLYLIGDSSVNYISGVTTTAATNATTSITSVTTSFQNLNIDPQIGTPWPNSAICFSHNIVMGNSFGVHVCYGGTVQKVSAPLDGFYNSVTNFAGLSASSAVAQIFGIQVFMMLLPVIDTITGQQVNKLLMWDGQNWFTAQQETNLTYIAGLEINSQLTAYGTDGTTIRQMFAQASTVLNKTVQSRLWAVPGYIFTKMSSRLFGLVDYVNAQASGLNISIDTNLSSSQTLVTVASAQLTWTNATGNTISWRNSSSVPIIWGLAGINVFGPIAHSQWGALLGLTLQTDAADMVLISLTLMNRVQTANL